jgi:hypothetical protein
MASVSTSSVASDVADSPREGDSPGTIYGKEILLDKLEPFILNKKNQAVSVDHLSKPNVLSLSDTIVKDVDAKKEKCFNEDVATRLARWCLIAFIPIVLLIILNFLTNDNTDPGEGDDTHYLSIILGVDIALLFTCYFLVLMGQLYGIPKCLESLCCKNQRRRSYLFKIETRLTTVEQWAVMRIANTQILYKLRAIQSISEFSAISGGLANHMIASLGPISWVGVSMLFAAHMPTTRIDIADAFLCIGVNGIVMIGMFELNTGDTGLVIGHYVGVGMAIFILFACLIQGVSISMAEENWTHLIMPVLLNVIAWPCFLYWMGPIQYLCGFPWCGGISSKDSAKQYEQQFYAYWGEGYTYYVHEEDKDKAYKDQRVYTKPGNGRVEVTDKLSEDFQEAKRKRGDGAGDVGSLTDEQLEEELKTKYIETRELREKVTTLSRKCVFFEGTAIYCVQFALAWYLFQWGNTCDYGCITNTWD